jgi:phosphoribosylaminoimidazole-succinocarboxamide synthase
VQKLYNGKTKDVFLRDDGNILLVFKDAVTGANGKIDPGANEVVGEMAGKGNASLNLTVYFFDLLGQAGLLTHFISTGPDPCSLIVKKARSFDLEVICREKAYGSFVRRYGKWVKEGASLPSLIEFTLKDDERKDPLITEDALAALNILSADIIATIKTTAQQATAIIKADLAKYGLELLDIKYEFGEVDGQTVIIDEVSGDSMRVMKDGKILLPDEVYEAMQ